MFLRGVVKSVGVDNTLLRPLHEVPTAVGDFSKFSCSFVTLYRLVPGFFLVPLRFFIIILKKFHYQRFANHPSHSLPVL